MFQFLIILVDFFSDTCVDDTDCKDIPHTVCRNIPVNEGLDPGTRGAAFEFWEPRDTILKSCFCKVMSNLKLVDTDVNCLKYK